MLSIYYSMMDMMQGQMEENDEDEDLFVNWLSALNRTCDEAVYMGPTHAEQQCN